MYEDQLAEGSVIFNKIFDRLLNLTFEQKKALVLPQRQQVNLSSVLKLAQCVKTSDKSEYIHTSYGLEHAS